LISCLLVDVLPYAEAVSASSTSEPGKAAPHAVEALRQAGIKELPKKVLSDVQSAQSVNEPLESGRLTRAETSTTTTAVIEQRAPVTSISSVPLVSAVIETPSKAKKSVSFADDTKNEHVSDSNTCATNGAQTQPQGPWATPAKPDNSPNSQRSDITLYDEEEDTPFEAVIPEHESPEDAALRRQMIDYNMGEVGAIVAELDLDEDDTPYSDDESELNDYDNSSAEEDEDKFGRTKRRVLNDDYLAEMQGLEQRLKNIGPDAATGTSSVKSGLEEEQHAGNAMGLQSGPQKSTPVTKRGIHFANDLDLPKAPDTGLSQKLPKALPSATIPEFIPVSRKPIHAPTVVERPPSATAKPSTIREPDELDPALVHQEVSTAYHRMRNHMIQRQGGFMHIDDEDEKGEVPLIEAEGGPKRVSRFKAARLGKLGN